MQDFKNKITPFLWFDYEVVKAAEFYVSVFGKNSGIKSITTLKDTPSGTVDSVTFELLGQEFRSIGAGPMFKFNPSISLHVLFNKKEDLDEIWAKLSEGGKVLMELGSYPFSDSYGWVKDKYGLTWQLMFFGSENIRQRIIPVFMFANNVYFKAEEAVKFWTSIFAESEVINYVYYGKEEEPDKEGSVKYSAFSLSGSEFGAMDSAYKHQFGFNEAFSFIVDCNDQEEIDYYWNELSADPNAEQCGWLKDKFGISWQIIPEQLDKLISDPDKNKSELVVQAMLKMKKIDISELIKAYEG